MFIYTNVCSLKLQISKSVKVTCNIISHPSVPIVVTLGAKAYVVLSLDFRKAFILKTLADVKIYILCCSVGALFQCLSVHFPLSKVQVINL